MSRAQRGSTEVFSYFRRARQHYENLGIRAEDDKSFLQFIGCSKTLNKKWYASGIRPIYKKMLNFIEENQRLRQDNQQFQEENQQLRSQLRITSGGKNH